MDREPARAFLVIQKVTERLVEEGDGSFIVFGDLNDGVERDKGSNNIEGLAAEMRRVARDRPILPCGSNGHENVRENVEIFRP